MGSYLILAMVAILVLYGIILYNNLVTLKHNVAKAWSNIDVLLKQRNEELPKLVEVCKQYMGFEQETLRQVMEARGRAMGAQQRGDMPALGEAEGALRLGLGNLFAVVEAYPELRASDKFKHLAQRISGLENAIADRREFYNESVNVNNIRIEQFPDAIIARPLGFKPFDLLEFPSQDLKDVDIKALFG